MAGRRANFKEYCMKQQGGKCYWCGRDVKSYEGWDKRLPLPNDYATVDHIYPEKDPIRQWYKKNRTPSPFVIACTHCNKTRGSTPVEEMEDRCKKPHKNWHKHFTAGAHTV